MNRILLQKIRRLSPRQKRLLLDALNATSETHALADCFNTTVHTHARQHDHNKEVLAGAINFLLTQTSFEGPIILERNINQIDDFPPPMTGDELVEWQDDILRDFNMLPLEIIDGDNETTIVYQIWTPVTSRTITIRLMSDDNIKLLREQELKESSYE